jgi:hypothetical protein
MREQRNSRAWRVASLTGGLAVAGYLMFGPIGNERTPVNLDIGEAKVTAQPSGTYAGRSFNVALGAGGGEVFHTGAVPAPSAAKQAARAAHEEARERAFRARGAMLPASDPNVVPQPAPRLGDLRPRTATDLTAGANAASPMADGSIAVYRATEIDPPAGFASSVGEPAAAQNGRFVFQTWNWFAARSTNGGASFSLIDPEAYGPGMLDFCCDQDVIHDKGNDRFLWERMGIGNVGTGGNNENRILINVSPDAFATNSCFADIRPLALFGLANAFMDYPRLALSNNYIYMSLNIFSFAGGVIGGYQTHILARFDLDALGDCVSLSGTFWNFPDGWSPTLVENAREIMYLGDHIITSTGLNSTFRVYWIFDSSTALNFVDRTIAPWQYTNGNASCPVPGGSNPCARADHRIVGAAIVHNTPLPNGLGGAGDKIDFYWNVRGAANGFAVPYTESAGFQGNTINYVQRKLLAYAADTVFYAAVGANDRQHQGLTAWWFRADQQPRMLFGIDDDFNGNAHSTGWETWQQAVLTSDANWNANSSGDYLRVRSHAPNGTGWILTGMNRDAAEVGFRPTYSVWGRGRDVNGFNRFDQQ